ncbi:zinc ribbon domain-containing protein [Lactococcus lactis]|uniref:zinc ribbon domain-containing protein n=1 Tax=Lactococcus lactis TaxID=1358 RepID=UPI0018C63281|nr:zinc ribbon domain-containing protein [Lactococcus lactis]MBG1279316.1 zinc ribbon domain-containing protein [Lactococcus lactis subsp. lactis]
MLGIDFKRSKKSRFEIAEQAGLSESEHQVIETVKNFDDFVVSIESLNQILLRDEREATFNVYKKTEKQTLYGRTLELPMVASTDFYTLLDKFNTNKPRAVEIEPFQVEELVEREEVSEEPEDSAVEVPQDLPEQEVGTKVEQKHESSQDEALAKLIAEKDAEIERLKLEAQQEYEKIPETPVSETFEDGEEPEEIEDFEPEQVKCQLCGANNLSSSRFCSNCGRSINSRQEVVPAESEIVNDVKEADFQELPMEFSQLFSLKDGWNIRPKIEKEVALEFEMRKDGFMKAVTAAVEQEKQKVIDEERQKFEAKEAKIVNDFSEKLEKEKARALIRLEDDKNSEIEKRIEVRRQYLTQWYQKGMAQLNGTASIKVAKASK